MITFPPAKAEEPAKPSATPVRLALVGTEATGDLAALLSARLGSLPGIVLLERAELSRLATEKQLQEFAAGDRLNHAFDLLKADGLLVLEKAGQGGPLTLRLFSTHNGLRLWSAEIPEKNPQELANKLADAVAEKAPKCLLASTNALPITVINLRAATFSPTNVEWEIKLTRLLEMQLDAEPGVVLLERRRLGEAQFERGLGAAIPESLQSGVLLVDGSFEVGLNDGEISLSLRVRGKEATREGKFKVKSEELNRLMQETTAFITGQQNKKEVLGAKETKEYLTEALWAETHGMDEMALEAGEAAVALGEKSVVLQQLLAKTYARLAHGEKRFYNGKVLEPVPASPQFRYDVILNALALCRELENQKQDVPKTEVLNAASEFLLELETDGNSELDMERIRVLLRELAPFDPTGKNSPYNFAYAADYAPLWAASLEDLLSFYKVWVESSEPKRFWVFKRLKREPEIALGKRFLSKEEARKHLVALAVEWKAQPGTELFGLLLLSRHGSTEESAAAYRQYLKLMADRAETLEKNGELDEYLNADWLNGRFDSNMAKERAEFLTQLFQVLKKYDGDLLSEYLDRGTFDPELAQAVWKNFNEYRKRILNSLPETEQSKTARAFNWHEKEFLMHYPVLKQPEAAHEQEALLVSHYWCAKSDGKSYEFGYNSLKVAGDTAWLIGNWNGRPGGSLIKVSLPELQDKEFPVGFSGTGGKMAITPDGVYVLHGKYPGNNRPMEMFLSRFDTALCTWEERSFQDASEIYSAGKKLYFSLWKHPSSRSEENGLLEYDWTTKESQLLASTRRKPPLNQLDESVNGRILGVFDGPKSKIWVVTGPPLSRVFILQKEDGNWKEIMDMDSPHCILSEGEALLAGKNGIVIHVNPEGSTVWLDAANPGEWEWGWRKPTGWTSQWLMNNALAFRPEDLFILNRKEGQSYELLWYWKGGPSDGLSIPVAFQLPDDIRKTIAAISENGNSSLFNADAIAAPEKASYSLKLIASRHGLLLETPCHGFWFIPNAALESKKADWLAGKRESITKNP
ncbi:MAG: hypothetical protein PHD76_06590 [Methylacidiphilales bacterium]|nr:hypothetical protein [Candidatus Methylacidiphilales bacterium]